MASSSAHRGMTGQPVKLLDRRVGLVAVVVLAIQLPFLWSPGVGQDADAWRLLIAGEILADSGLYTMSRPPGNPVVDLVSAALAGAPTWAYIALTAVITAVAVIAFADLLRTLQVTAWIPLTIGLALTPVILRNGVTFMDYNWSLAFLLASWAAVARSGWILAGATFGLAMACRPATAIMVVVVVVILWRQREPLHNWMAAVALPGLVVFMFFAVPVALFGSGVLGAVPEDASLAVVAGRASVGVWGSFGAVAVVVALIAVVVLLIRGRQADLVAQPWTMAACVGLVAQVGLFLVLPADAGYLSAAVPLVWLLTGTILPGAAVIALTAVVAASSFVAPSSSDVFGTTLLKDREERIETERYLSDLSARIDELPAGAVVVAGYHMPQLIALHPSAVATLSRVADPTRPAIGNRFVLPGGQILSGSLEETDRDAESIYQLPVVDDGYPILTVSG